MGISHPKTSLKCGAILLNITGGITGVITPKDKTKPMPKTPLLEKKAVRMINNLIKLGL